jgi:hypothetical protein
VDLVVIVVSTSPSPRPRGERQNRLDPPSLIKLLTRMGIRVAVVGTTDWYLSLCSGASRP